MKNFLKIMQGVNVTSLALQLHQHPELWNVDTERLGPKGPHHDSDDIWVRYNDKTEWLKSGDWSTFNDEHDPVWYPAFYALPAVRSLVFDLARGVEAERIGGIFIWRVKPEHQIYPHKDFGWHVGYYDKFNICIQSAPGCAFVYEDEKMEDRPGEVHRFVNTENHSVINQSSEDYIVLCVCLRIHDYERRYQR